MEIPRKFIIDNSKSFEKSWRIKNGIAKQSHVPTKKKSYNKIGICVKIKRKGYYLKDWYKEGTSFK